MRTPLRGQKTTVMVSVDSGEDQSPPPRPLDPRRPHQPPPRHPPLHPPPPPRPRPPLHNPPPPQRRPPLHPTHLTRTALRGRTRPARPGALHPTRGVGPTPAI